MRKRIRQLLGLGGAVVLAVMFACDPLGDTCTRADDRCEGSAAVKCTVTSLGPRRLESQACHARCTVDRDGPFCTEAPEPDVRCPRRPGGECAGADCTADYGGFCADDDHEMLCRDGFVVGEGALQYPLDCAKCTYDEASRHPSCSRPPSPEPDKRDAH